MSARLEYDSLGKVCVPSSAYYGCQTERSKHNFDIASETDRMPTLVVQALIILKISAAECNELLGCLSKEKADLIVEAGKTCLKNFILWKEQFPLVVWQTGSGTQTNMNVNEVLANICNTNSGQSLGSKTPIHPNDHVNMSQSSNDTFPTAMNVAAVISVRKILLPSLIYLRDSLIDKRDEYANIVKIGRTHMQDAVPLTVGQELSGYISQLDFSIKRISSSISTVASELAIGGTAVGTGLNTVMGFDTGVCARLSENVEKYMGFNEIFSASSNKFSALAAHDSLMALSGDLNTVATALMRLANDFRLLGSGPRCGIGEFLLPEKEPGSSIMPGKVNPTQCESLSMVCAQVMGNCVATTIGCSQGHLELNVYKPLIIRNLLHSIRLLADSSTSFAKHCVSEMNLNLEKIKEYMEESLMLVTALNPFIGYDKSAMVAKYAHEKNCTLKEAAVALSLVSEDDFDKWVVPSKMLQPKSL